MFYGVDSSVYLGEKRGEKEEREGTEGEIERETKEERMKYNSYTLSWC
jgi:hypothetical protein